MHELKRYGKIIIFDTLAVLCFIGVVLFGWLPGPGGIPLLILGLSLLAVNHDWAERWIETVKIHGVTIKSYLFPKNRVIRILYDVASIIIVSIGLYLSFTSEMRILSALGAIMTSGALIVFLFNRDRIDKLADIFNKFRKR